MKLFKVEFDYLSSHPELSVVFADSKKEVKEIMTKHFTLPFKPRLDKIVEVKPEAGIVYTGYYCC